MQDGNSFRCDVRLQADGSQLVAPHASLPPFPARLTDWLVQWEARAPERTLIAERAADGAWRRVTYREALTAVRAIGAGLLGRELSAERPVVILSGNSIEHFLLALAAMYIGVPYVPVSPAYSLSEGELGRLRDVMALLTPGLVAAFGSAAFARALSTVVPAETELIADAQAGAAAGRAYTTLPTLAVHDRVDEADAAHARVSADTIAKFLLTSGSTGHPKAVITTQRMLCSNQLMILQALPFMSGQPPLLVDWLPWNHVFGGNHNVGIVLAHGGSLYIDDGRPVPGGIDATVRNLRELSPTVYFNVPKGLEMLVPHLQRDAQLRRNFFRDLNAVMYAGAGLSAPVWDALDALALEETGRRVPIISGLGSTETAPAVTLTTPEMGRAGAIGLPTAGNLVKLVPIERKLEIRVKGPNVTPGYWRAPALTAAAFDDEGFYRLGDAVRWLNPGDPQQGLMFDGRISEDFKLSSGTWVSVGPLRISLLNVLTPLVQDVVIAGLNQDWLGVLIFADPRACAAALPEVGVGAGAAELAAHPALLRELTARLQRHYAQSTGSSTRIVRALVLDAPPALDAGEITDKGSINQRAVLQRRADKVELLYAAIPPAGVMCVAAPDQSGVDE